MKTALGMIISSLDSDTELTRFLDNADRYGHKFDCIIVAYTLRLDPRVERSLNKRVPFFAVDIKYPRYSLEQFRRRNMSGSATRTLLECPMDTKAGLVPYGFNRNAVVLEALLRDVELLFFVDSDVYPSVLRKTPEGVITEEVDFFGAHLEHINSGSLVTTAEYSGYNILPPASFACMEDLLIGLQKPEMLDYWLSSESHRCLTVQKPVREAKPCEKTLGGNTAIKLSGFSELPPFFSSYYTLGGESFLSRGEDTILGMEVAEKGLVCTDIGVNPLHDTYKNYPTEPDLLGDPSAQDRFYYACTGWVGRNPFLSYIRGDDLHKTRTMERECLERGLRALAEYTSNPRFFSILRNFDTSWDSLGRYISEYERIQDAWEEVRSKIMNT